MHCNLDKRLCSSCGTLKVHAFISEQDQASSIRRNSETLFNSYPNMCIHRLRVGKGGDLKCTGGKYKKGWTFTNESQWDSGDSDGQEENNRTN